MKPRKYYSLRTGKHPARRLNLPILKDLFLNLYNRWEESGFFQEWFGYFCLDSGDVPGKLGEKIDAAVEFALRKRSVWPIGSHITEYSEEDLFDAIEFLHDHISKPLKGHHHDYNACGWHYSTFDPTEGQMEYRTEINALLEDYSSGYKLNNNGEIENLPEPGMDQLLKAEIKSADIDVKDPMEAAVRKFQRYKATVEDRRDAVLSLAAALEKLRPQLKIVLTKADDADLFNIANKFHIRHNDAQQRRHYDRNIWLNWMFYFYLATLHAATRFLEKAEKEKRAGKVSK